MNEEFFNDEEFRELLEEYEQTVEAGEMVFMDTEDLADIADYYMFNNRPKEADKVIERALELEPDSPFILSYLIHLAISKKDYKAAEDYLSQMTDEQHPEYIYGRAEIWIAQGMTDEADKYLSNCQKLYLMEMDREDYVYDVVNLWTDYNCNEKALEWMMRVPPQDTDEYLEMMGRIYLGVDNCEEAERIFNNLIDRNPFQKRYWKALADTQYMKEDYSSALTSCEYAIALDPEDPESLLCKANIHYQLNDFEEAQKYYERTAEKREDEAVLYNLACCLVNLGRNAEAEKQLMRAEKAALADSPYLTEIYQELGYVYGELRLLDKALQYIDKAISRCKDVNREAELIIIRGHILLGNGKLEDALKSFEKGIALSGYSAYIELRAIVSVYDNHYLETAYEMFKKFFDLNGTDSTEGYSYMALCCYDMKRFDEYLLYLEKACQSNPKQAKKVLGYKFPEALKPEEYYEYAKNEMKK